LYSQLHSHNFAMSIIRGQQRVPALARLPEFSLCKLFNLTRHMSVFQGLPLLNAFQFPIHLALDHESGDTVSSKMAAIKPGTAAGRWSVGPDCEWFGYSVQMLNNFSKR
jgi:hypothetical protein